MQLTLEITPDLIAMGIACDCVRCPIALAGLNAGFKYFVSISEKIRAADFCGDRQYYEAATSPKIAEFMEAFDNGESTLPFTETLDFRVFAAK